MKDQHSMGTFKNEREEKKRWEEINPYIQSLREDHRCTFTLKNMLKEIYDGIPFVSKKELWISGNMSICHKFLMMQ